VVCSGAANCRINCENATHCGFASCWAGTPIACPDGTLSCGSDCSPGVFGP
jgi:hypothetical protein